MKTDSFAQQFRALYDKAVSLYAQNQRAADTFFTPAESAFLAANGITAQHLYDYAEDHNNYDGVPGFDLALGIEHVRRDYFIEVQHSKPSPNVLDPETLPEKTASLSGIEWLPRIIIKARAKLRGELPASLMYCCGGDRRFFAQHALHAPDFLRLIWRAGTDEQLIVNAIKPKK